MQDVVLALLAKEPCHGYDLRARLQEALGPLGETLNAGQIYVTLGRLERAGLVSVSHVEQAGRPDRKMYALTPAGQERLTQWLADVGWTRPAPTEFHLKLVAAAASRLADPVALVDAQRSHLLRQLAGSQRAALKQPPESALALLLEAVVLRLEADLQWLELCEEHWARESRH
jgi:DNA-binding PadR family transcriptional regulator